MMKNHYYKTLCLRRIALIVALLALATWLAFGSPTQSSRILGGSGGGLGGIESTDCEHSVDSTPWNTLEVKHGREGDVKCVAHAEPQSATITGANSVEIKEPMQRSNGAEKVQTSFAPPVPEARQSPVLSVFQEKVSAAEMYVRLIEEGAPFSLPSPIPANKN